MRFIPESHIEEQAAALWQRYRLSPGFDVERLLDQLLPGQELVVLNERHLDALEAKNGRLRRYTMGHEVGHWELHSEATRSGALRLLPGGRTWCREKSPDPLERQAEIYSAALLMPSDRLRTALPKRPWRG